MGALAQVLRGLPRSTDPNLLVGTDTLDDAGVYRLDESTALVMTTDFFPPLVDDAFAFGRIAAANSLSDIYAMGGRPLCALNLVGFPDGDLPPEILGEILRGGAERVTAAGAVIAGGHSVRDAEIKYGLAVTGLIHPDRIITNAGARDGDRLVLTKPIGSGILTSAAKADRITLEDLAETIDVMVDLNAGACAAMLDVGVHAATDVTGFGLIGHAHEMAGGSGVTIGLIASEVPLIDGALRFARAGVLTRAHRSNLEYVGDRLDPGAVEQVLVGVLADAQTSGGLLIAVAADRTDALVTGLRKRNTCCASVVGSIGPKSTYTVVLR
jgi:selenide,water dikinase